MSFVRTAALTIGAVVFSGAVGIGGYLAMGGKLPGARDCPGGIVGASIGGPFELTSHTGERAGSATLKGKPTLLYFGYATCPDVCPTELADMAAAVDLLEKDGLSVQPVFISVDPERDTPEILAEHVPFFHDRMIGMTGTPEEIAATAKAFRIFYSRVADPDFPDGYAMDHSSIVYLLDDDANYQTYFKYEATPEDIAAGVSCHLG